MKKIIDTYPEIAGLILDKESQFKKNRASITVKKCKGKARVQIEAKDKSALQAAAASVQKIIIIYEKARNLCMRR